MTRCATALVALSLSLFAAGCGASDVKDTAGAGPAAETPPAAIDNTTGLDASGAPESGAPDGPAPAEAPPVGLEVGNLAPEFKLTDIDGVEHSLAQYRGKVVVLEWMNHGCPYVKKHYNAGNMQALQKAATADGVVWLSICSSAPGKQGHMDNAKWKQVQAKKGAAPTAVLPDPDGTVGHLYNAQNTPSMWVLDTEGRVAYTGAIDDNARAKGDDIAAARNYVTEALAAVKAGTAPAVTTTDPYG